MSTCEAELVVGVHRFTLQCTTCLAYLGVGLRLYKMKQANAYQQAYFHNLKQ